MGYSALLKLYDSNKDNSFETNWTRFLLNLYIRQNIKELSTNEQQLQLLGITGNEVQKKKQIETAAKVKSFNNIVGVIMRLCLEGTPDRRYNYLKKVVTPFEKQGFVSQQEKENFLEDFQSYIIPACVWRSSYLAEASEYFNFRNSPLTQQEKHILKRYTDYYTDKTGIPFTPENIELTISKEDNFILMAHQLNVCLSEEPSFIVSLNKKEINLSKEIKKANGRS